MDNCGNNIYGVPIYQVALALQENTRNPTAIFVGISSEWPYSDDIPTKTVVGNIWSEKKICRKFVTNSDEIPTSTDRHYSDGYSDNIFHRKCFVGNWSEYISNRSHRRKNVRQNSDKDVTLIFRRNLNPSEFPGALSVEVRRKTPTGYFVGNIRHIMFVGSFRGNTFVGIFRRCLQSEISDGASFVEIFFLLFRII